MQWKCEVCNQVFDYLPEICPVCGARREAFNIYIEDNVPQKKDTDEKFVIIGGGVAGFETVKAIRERNLTASVTLICGEKILPYNRPALSDVIGENLKLSDIILQKDFFFKKKNITIINDLAESIDLAKKTVSMKNGANFVYDKLCIATGANAFCPFSSDEIPVKTLRTYSDTTDIISSLKENGKVIIAGGGILGIEAAVALRARNISVTVLERNKYIVANQLDIKASEMLKAALETEGVTILTEKSIDKTDKNGAILNDGSHLGGDFILVSMGIRSELTLAAMAGLSINRGIIVDDTMKTNIDGIYAAGDCAEYKGKVGGLWSIASAQGKIAGAAMCGDVNNKSTVPPPATAFEGANISFFAVGAINNTESTIKTSEDIASGLYKKLLFTDNKLTGVLLFGDTAKSGKALSLVMSGADSYEAEKELL